MQNTIIDILERLESDNSRLLKEELLDYHKSNDLLKRVFSTVGDPYTNFYVKKFKMPTSCEMADDDDVVIEKFLDFLTMSLATRSVTGNSAKEVVTSFFSRLSERQQKWCLRILLKNLRCGVQSTTVNKVWPESIKGFSVQLADSLRTRHETGKGIFIEDVIEYPVRVEPKLDGLRCVVVKSGGEVSMFTRSGSIIDTLPRIKAAIDRSSWDNFVLDGEVMGADWNESASVVMSHKRGKDDSGMIFHVFDAVPFTDWRDGECDLDFTTRTELVAELVDEIVSREVVPVTGIIVKNEGELLEFYSQKMEEGYEGIMIKDLKAKYAFKRSSAVLKMKPISTYEGMIVGNYLGNRGTKREGMWGGFEIVLPNGVITRVGGGFTDKLKAEIDMDPESWIGRIIEVEGQPDPATKDGLTKDGKVRFPVFTRERSAADVDRRILETGHAYLSRAAC